MRSPGQRGRANLGNLTVDPKTGPVVKIENPSRKRRSEWRGNARFFGAAFEAKVAVAVVMEVETASQLASIHGVHPTQIHQWKKQLLDGAEGLFSTGSGTRRSQSEEQCSTAELFEQIGRLKMELEFCKFR